MKLEKLNPQGRALTREETLTLKGGTSNPTLTGTSPHRTDLGASTADDYDDADGD